jgi:DNA-binding beta-propeller fold protein YncE
MATALSPDGRYLLVLNGGYKPPTISVLDAATGREIHRVPVADGWLGLTFSPKGDRVYVSGGSRAAVYEFSFADGALEPTRTFAVVTPDKRTHADFIGDVALTPDGRLIYAAELYHDSPLPHPLPSGWQVLLRHELGGWLRRAL